MSSTAGVPPYVLETKGQGPAPYTLTVPASLEIRPDTATAKFDGTGASGDFLACLTFYGTNGERLGRYFNPNPVKAGTVAEVTFTPPFGSAATSIAAGGITSQLDFYTLGGRGGTVVAGPPHGNTFLAWALQSGPGLLDLANPDVPKAITAGLYIIVIGGGSITDSPGDSLTLNLDTSKSGEFAQTAPLIPSNAAGPGFLSAQASVPTSVPLDAGDVLLAYASTSLAAGITMGGGATVVLVT